MTTGWTFTQGSAGEEVGKDVVIFSSQSCLSTLKAGSTTNKKDNDTSNLSNDEAKEVLKEDKKKKKSFEDAKIDYDIKMSGLQTDYRTATIMADTYTKIYQNDLEMVQFYKEQGYPSESIYTKKNQKKIDNDKKQADKYTNQKKELEEKMKTLAEEFSKEWGVSSAVAGDTTDEPPIIEAQKALDQELDDLTNQINNMNLNMSTTSQVAAWFDAIEQYIDSMPQMKEDTSPLYEVEQRGVKWYYTGNSAIPDPEFNKKIREFKQAQCKKLNSLIESITKELEKKLNDLAKKCVYIYPLIEAIKVIQGGVSIDTLVKWGKAVINFCTSIYQMFYTTYKTIMETMELIVIRVPQLISKLMSKVAELDCPIETRSLDVKFPSSAEAANIKAENKNKKKK